MKRMIAQYTFPKFRRCILRAREGVAGGTIPFNDFLATIDDEKVHVEDFLKIVPENPDEKGP